MSRAATSGFSGKSASLVRVRRVERVRALVDMANDTVFVDHESNAVSEKASEVEDSVSLGHFLFGVNQQWEAGAGLLGELAVSFLAIETNP
jgi:hypothetical protein